MKHVQTYRIDGSKTGDKRPDIYVTLDRENIELRRKGSRTVDEFCVELDLQEAGQLSVALLELLPKEPRPSHESDDLGSDDESPSFP